MDLFFPYDGYSVNAVNVTEAAGWCGPGEAWDLFRTSTAEDGKRLKLNGRTWVSTNGGSLSQGRAGGFNYFTESVIQLRGHAGERQVPGASTSPARRRQLYHDPVAAVLRTD